EKKQKSTDRTEFTKNLVLKLKHFNSSHTPEIFFHASTHDFLNVNSVMSEENQDCRAPLAKTGIVRYTPTRPLPLGKGEGNINKDGIATIPYISNPSGA
ncbi:MAG TPA: hypothetical protein VFJ67_02240, partial [Thermodesulfobacteriota bacterium]|nr:hypothetical protein [Thermodesulfobacteriota bacterium]